MKFYVEMCFIACFLYFAAGRQYLYLYCFCFVSGECNDSVIFFGDLDIEKVPIDYLQVGITVCIFSFLSEILISLEELLLQFLWRIYLMMFECFLLVNCVTVLTGTWRWVVDV